MEAERLLISKVAHSGGLERMMADGITADHFGTEDGSKIWAFMTEYHSKYGQAPSISAIKSEFPNYHFEATNDALPFLKEKFVAELERRLVDDKMWELAVAKDGRTHDGRLSGLLFDKWQEVVQSLPATGQIYSLKDIGKRIAEYEANKASGQGVGIPMGIDYFDALTQGIQHNDYITVAGWTGTGKSTLVQWMLLNAYRSGVTPLFISLEMEPRALMRKWDTMLTNFSYHRLKSLNLTDDEEARWKEVAKEVSTGRADIRVAGDKIQKLTTDEVYGLACRHRPGIIAIDYITLMDLKQTRATALWEAVTDLTRDLKAMARTLQIPIIGVAQTNRDSEEKGATLGNIAYSNSINQDSDIVLGLGKRTPAMMMNHQAEVRLNKNRDGAVGEAKLYWKMDTMEFREWKDSDMWLSEEAQQVAS